MVVIFRQEPPIWPIEIDIGISRTVFGLNGHRRWGRKAKAIIGCACHAACLTDTCAQLSLAQGPRPQNRGGRIRRAGRNPCKAACSCIQTHRQRRIAITEANTQVNRASGSTKIAHRNAIAPRRQVDLTARSKVSAAIVIIQDQTARFVIEV